jgi:sugar phosphate isomerase/epimerase
MAAHFRIGNQTTKHLADSLRPYHFALEHGMDAFEWFSDKGRYGWCEDDHDAAARARLKAEGRRLDIAFSIHAPYAAAPLDETGRAAIAKSIAFGHDIGARVVNLHLVTEAGPREFAKAMRPLVEQARAAGVLLSLENTPATTPDDFNAVFTELRRDGASPWVVGMCFDMGHANLCGTTRNDYCAYVDRLGPQVPINHWHAHENWGDRDSHLPLFTGPLARNDLGLRGLLLRLMRRGFNGNVVLEQWPEPPEVLVEARDKLRSLIAEVERTPA